MATGCGASRDTRSVKPVHAFPGRSSRVLTSFFVEETMPGPGNIKTQL